MAALADVTHPLALESVFSFPALWAAARRAARGRRTHPTVARFRLDLEPRLFELRRALLAGTWRPSPVHHLLVHDPKPRRISVPPFADRVVHQALGVAAEPRHERRMIDDSYACRRDHGTHAALRKAAAWSRTYARWVRLDVAQFFPSIDHAIVRAQLARDLPPVPLRALCERILAAGGTRGGLYVPGDDLFAPVDRVVGLPLGSLMSQLWANRYLDPVDHLVKDRLRVRAYLRYMDDMLLFHDDARALSSIAREVEGACHALRLRLHPWSVQPTKAGVGFVGYRVMGEQVRVRRTSVNRAMRRLRWRMAQGEDLSDAAFRDALRSVFAHWRHADSWRLRTRALRELGLHADDDSRDAER